MILELSQFFSGVIYAYAVWYQWKYNKLHRSIYGLSYDLYIFKFVGSLISFWCGLHYLFSPLVRNQLADRFPLFYSKDNENQVPVSKLLLVKDVVLLISNFQLLRQLVLYRSSKHVHQSVSKLCFGLITLTICFSVFTYTCSAHNLPTNSGKFGVFYLEHVNYLWVLGNIWASLELIPQASLNWMGKSTTGLSSKFVVLTAVGTIIDIIGTKFYFRQGEYYLEPFNRHPIFVPISQFMLIMLIFYQAQFVYWGSKPYLPKGKSTA